jgi:hypothetical protein
MEGGTVIDVTLHFRGQGQQRRRLPCLPTPDCHIEHKGTLYRVADVVLGKTVDVYCLTVGESLSRELIAKWAAWGKPLE